MNIKITKPEFERLYSWRITQFTVGSKLYETHNNDSDTDILVIVKFPNEWAYNYFPSNHQFHYDDLENNIQYIFSSERQFWQNQMSGDSTINSDVILFHDGFTFNNNKEAEDYKISLCRTYKVIKAYLGFAKRDISMIGKKNKEFHIWRSLYTAEMIITGLKPQITDIQEISKLIKSGKSKSKRAIYLLGKKS